MMTKMTLITPDGPGNTLETLWSERTPGFSSVIYFSSSLVHLHVMSSMQKTTEPKAREQVSTMYLKHSSEKRQVRDQYHVVVESQEKT